MALPDLACHDLDDAIGEGTCALALVAGDDHSCSGSDRLSQQRVELVTALGIEPRMRLVEQPQLGAASDEASERGAPGLTGGELSDEHVLQATVDAEPLHRRRHLLVGRIDGRAPELNIFGDGQIAV